VFAFTDKRLYSVLASAHARKVQIRVIVDDTMAEMQSAKASLLAQLGIEVRVDASKFHMHHKFAIVDNTVILTGSFNWTVQARQSNRENLLITSDEQIISQYAQEFNVLWQEYQNHHL
jgi:mitochondrial cardiolipin hydrolase